MKNNDRPLTHGFTLVELLVVIVIIASLVAISLTMVIRFRQAGDKVVATNNLRQIQAANMGYAAEQSGRFVPPEVEFKDDSGTVIGTYKWFQNPDFISQIKGISATYKTSGPPDTSLELSLMDPAVVRTRATGYKELDSSYGYTTAVDDAPHRQAQLNDPSRSAAFITAEEGFADFASLGNIQYRHSDKAIVAYYDGHAGPITLTQIEAKPESDVFWNPVEAP